MKLGSLRVEPGLELCKSVVDVVRDIIYPLHAPVKRHILREKYRCLCRQAKHLRRGYRHDYLQVEFQRRVAKLQNK